MTQLYSTTVSERVMNVPCTGKFYIKVESDGFFEIDLEHRDGRGYMRSRGSMSQAGTFLDHEHMESIVVPDWMWDSICATIAEMTIALERDALDTPQADETWV